jgi:hypothetical protein
MYFSSYATSNEVVVFHLPLLLRAPRLRLFLLGVLSGPRAASLRMLKTVFLLVPVAVAVSAASQLTDLSRFLALRVKYFDHNLPFLPFKRLPTLAINSWNISHFTKTRSEIRYRESTNTHKHKQQENFCTELYSFRIRRANTVQAVTLSVRNRRKVNQRICYC